MTNTAKKNNKKKTEGPEETHGTGKVVRRRKPLAIVDALITDVQTKLSVELTKPTIGDLIRLLQFKKDLTEDEAPRAIEVTWVQPTEEQSDSER
jgi:hypothetical protein